MKFRFGLKRWRHRKPFFALLILELPLTIVILVLFGIADPDTYRDKLWQDGFNNGFNSSPSQPIFDLVNGKPEHIPLVWSDLMTKFNLTLSILTVFILLVKSVFFVIKWLYPILSLLVHVLQLGLVSYSLYLQSAPDTIDPHHVNNGLPWYITHSCSVASLKENVGYCQQAKASFIFTIVFVALYCIYILLTIHSIFFSPEKKEEDEESFTESKGKEPKEPQWEMVPIPETPGTAYSRHFPLSPTTPRTRAFNALEGDRQVPRPQFPPPPKKAKKK